MNRPLEGNATVFKYAYDMLEKFVYIPTNLVILLHSWLTSSPLQALTSKVVSVGGLSPDSLVMTMVVVEPSTNFSL